MKKLITWANHKIQKMDIVDIGLLKLSMFLIGLIAGAFSWAFIRNWIGYFSGVTIFVCSIVIMRFFLKK